MGSFLIQLAGVILVIVGVALIYWPVAFIVAGLTVFSLGWLLDGDVLDSEAGN